MRAINYPLSPPAVRGNFYLPYRRFFSECKKKMGLAQIFFLNGPAAGVSAARRRREKSRLARPRVTAVPSIWRAEAVGETRGGDPADAETS